MTSEFTHVPVTYKGKQICMARVSMEYSSLDIPIELEGPCLDKTVRFVCLEDLQYEKR